MVNLIHQPMFSVASSVSASLLRPLFFSLRSLFCDTEATVLDIEATIFSTITVVAT